MLDVWNTNSLVDTISNGKKFCFGGGYIDAW